MAAVKSPVGEQLRQLNDVRKVVLGNSSHYPVILQGILPIISPSSLPELRRWGAEFLAEAFGTPALPSRDKETLSLLVLDSLKVMVEDPNEDVHVLRSTIQVAASIYPFVMRWMYVAPPPPFPFLLLIDPDASGRADLRRPLSINNSYDTPTWERMVAIKSRILRIWESALPSVKICCIKFAQRVVLAQTAGTNSEQKVRGPERRTNMADDGAKKAAICTARRTGHLAVAGSGKPSPPRCAHP